jgi:hypothetical protein
MTDNRCLGPSRMGLRARAGGLKSGLDVSWMACVGNQMGYAMWAATQVYNVEAL